MLSDLTISVIFCDNRDVSVNRRGGKKSNRKQDAETATLPNNTFNFDNAAPKLDNAARDAQSQARSAVHGAVRLTTIKTIKDVGQIGLGDARSSIHDRNAHVPVIAYR